MKKLLIDCNTLVYRHGMSHLAGIGRTTQDLLLALKNRPELPFDITIFTQTIRGVISEDIQSVKRRNIPLPLGGVSDWIMKKIPLLDLISPHDLLHIPNNYCSVYNPDKVVVTIHDAMFFSYPESFLGHEYARKYYPQLARSCRAIITCSESSKSDIVNYMDVNPEKITVAPWGVNDGVFYPTDAKECLIELQKTLGLSKPYYLSISCDIGRKNTLSIMQAFRLALKSNIEHELVLVWGDPPAEYTEEFAKEINSGKIRILRHVNDLMLRQLYTASTLSWFPSRYEGFGLPVLESMACGTPVVTCKNSSLSEVGGDAALYVDPDDIEGMADIMIDFNKGFSTYDDLVSRSIEHASRFTWAKTAEAYVKFYQSNM
jgi:glycosyltransferase involved in cell wall biosynthesis